MISGAMVLGTANLSVETFSPIALNPLRNIFENKLQSTQRNEGMERLCVGDCWRSGWTSGFGEKSKAGEAIDHP